MDYKSLEPSAASPFGINNSSLSFNPGQPVSFYASSFFVYTILFVAIVAAAFYRYIRAALWRVQASQTSIGKSNEAFRTATLGLLGAFSLFLILYTFNKDLLVGDVGLGALKAEKFAGGGATGNFTAPPPVTNQTPPTTPNSPSCGSKDDTIAALSSPGGICASTNCTKLSGCTYQQYLPIIKEESTAVGVDYKVTVAIICRESDGRENPPQRTGADRNSDNSSDCGLMQVNSKTPTCPPSLLDPRTNIREGLKKIKAALSGAGQIYPNIQPMTNAFANYNCCSNGDIPSSPSNDCTPATGFPFTPPKWACPINPGTDRYNMCAVKNYACEITKCAAAVP